MNTELLYLKTAAERCSIGASLARTRAERAEYDSEAWCYYARMEYRWERLERRYTERAVDLAFKIIGWSSDERRDDSGGPIGK